MRPSRLFPSSFSFSSLSSSSPSSSFSFSSSSSSTPSSSSSLLPRLLLFLLSLSSLAVAQLDPQDLDAFNLLYTSTNGAEWIFQPNLEDLCASAEHPLLLCDAEGIHIVQLTLSANNLVGSIPSALSMLTFLDLLDLTNNTLDGTIPTELQSLGLSTLLLAGNQLTCPLRNYQTWAETNDYTLAIEPCEDLPAVNCTGQTIDHAWYPSVVSGTNSTGQCEAGFFGNPILECVQVADNATFSTTQLGTPCEQVYCSPATIDLVTYSSTQAGQTAYGVCPSGYSGFPTRLCEQHQDTASFSANLTSGSCQMITCPQAVIGFASYRETPVFRNTVGLCPSGWTGNPALTCNLVNNAGVWSTNSTGRRCIENCPAVILHDAHFVSTPVGQSRQGLCVEGYSGFPVLRCLEDIDHDTGIWDFEVEGFPCEPVEGEGVHSGRIAGGILGTIAILFILAMIFIYFARKRGYAGAVTESFVPLDELHT